MTNVLFNLTVKIYNNYKEMLYPNLANAAIYLNSISEMPNEEEVIFPSGTFFNVVGINKD